MRVFLILLLVAPAAAHEAVDESGDQVPPTAGHLDLTAVRLLPGDNVTLEVEFSALDPAQGWWLRILLDRTDATYELACSFPRGTCRLDRTDGQLSEGAVTTDFAVDGNRLHLEAPFSAWSEGDFRIRSVDARVFVQVSTGVVEPTSPEPSDVLEAAVDWDVAAPGNVTDASGGGAPAGDDGRAAAQEPAPGRDVPGLPVAWLAAVLLGVRR